MKIVFFFFPLFPFKSALDQVTWHQNPLDFAETKPGDLSDLNPGLLAVFQVPKGSGDGFISYFMEILWTSKLFFNSTNWQLKRNVIARVKDSLPLLNQNKTGFLFFQWILVKNTQLTALCAAALLSCTAAAGQRAELKPLLICVPPQDTHSTLHTAHHSWQRL